MEKTFRPSVTRSAFVSFLGLLALTSCSTGAGEAAPTPTPKSSQLIDIGHACDGTLSSGAETAQKLLGEREVQAGPAKYQSSVEQVTSLLRTDIPGGGGLATARSLCAVQPKNSRAWLTISFRWKPYVDVPPPSASTRDESEYSGIGYGASSDDSEVLIGFSCRVPNAGLNDGHGMFILASADTEGLNALSGSRKREAQVRVLHAASVAVATAMHCSTNLPAKLGTLKALPLAP